MLHLDIETRSATDLTKCGVYAYAEDPEFDILMCAWAHDDDEVQIAIGREQIEAISGLSPHWSGAIMAHGAQFERICFSQFLGMDGFWDPEQWIDSQAMAAEAGYPKKLEKLAVALGGEQKDSAGTRLINLFSKPRKDGTFVQPQDRPVEWQQFIDYCIQDVVTMRDAARKLPNLIPFEEAVWEVDQRINDRGILADLEMAELAVYADYENQAGFKTELRELIGVQNAGSIIQIRKGLKDRLGLELPNLQKETIDEVLAQRQDLTPEQRRALFLRQETALVASDKYSACLRSASPDGRYRGGMTFYGAHTGRWSSKGVQVHNLPKLAFTKPDPNDPSKQVHDLAAEQAAIMDLLLNHGADALTLKKLVRALFIGPFTVVDYASIEARILAWWAGEKWAIEAFADNRDIYSETAKRMGGLTRAQGKIAVLALGYNGSVGSLRNMGYGVGMSDEKVLELVFAWRRANPRIVRMWKLVEEAFMNGGKIGPVSFTKQGKTRRIHLPSGRTLSYHNVGTSQGSHGRRIMFDSPMGHRTDTYGGRLTENVVQAISRDVLALALVNLERAGYPVVLHVHDEVVAEGEHDIEVMSKIMCDVPWAEGLPLGAEGFHTARYRKG